MRLPAILFLAATVARAEIPLEPAIALQPLGAVGAERLDVLRKAHNRALGPHRVRPVRFQKWCVPENVAAVFNRHAQFPNPRGLVLGNRRRDALMATTGFPGVLHHAPDRPAHFPRHRIFGSEEPSRVDSRRDTGSRAVSSSTSPILSAPCFS